MIWLFNKYNTGKLRCSCVCKTATIWWYLILYPLISFSQSAEIYEGRMDTLSRAIFEHFYDNERKLFFNNLNQKQRHRAYLWDLCAMLQATNEIKNSQPKNSYFERIINAIRPYYDTGSPPAYKSTYGLGSIGERYYDDNEWLAITFLDAYKRTGDKWFLKKSLLLYKFIMTGYDDVAGGGIYWKEGDKSSKNTCSNGPAILLSLRLYEITKNKEFLITALKLYNWVYKYLRSEIGIYWDAIKPLRFNQIDKATFAYNSGTMLEANVWMYKATKGVHYLAEAERMAEASFGYFYGNGTRDSSYWFNTVLLRGYEALYQITKDKRYMIAMATYGEKVWRYERDGFNLVGLGHQKELLHQAGMVEFYARLARFFNDQRKGINRQ